MSDLLDPGPPCCKVQGLVQTGNTVIAKTDDAGARATPRALMLLLTLAVAEALPRWSWDTVQTYIHCANITGEWNGGALHRLAQQPFVVFEKNHKLFAPPMNTSGEAKIAESCRLVKQLSPTTDCYMYTENDVARTYYSLGHW